MSHLPQHLYSYLCTTDQGPEHRQGFREGLYRSSFSLTRILKDCTCQTAHARGVEGSDALVSLAHLELVHRGTQLLFYPPTDNIGHSNISLKKALQLIVKQKIKAT